jgi:hypothetical protein
MPRLIPKDPAFTTESERVVWERLRDTLGDDDVLMANLRLTDEDKDHEADLVVLMPEVGVLVLEVKGGGIRWDDGWVIQRNGRDRRVDPVEQARRTKYALREYVERNHRWTRGRRVVWAHGVVTPFSDFPDTFDAPDLPRWALHDRGDQQPLGGRIAENTRRLAHNQSAPTYDDVDRIVEILNGPVPTAYDVTAVADERAAEADRLTQEQATLLRVTRLLNRVEIRGGAGSGKTVLAMQQAKELTRGRGDRPAQRVAILCYSIGLATFLKREVASWHRKDRPAFVGTFHEFGMQWGAPPETDRSRSDFWEVELPRIMDRLAAELPETDRYDAIVVDEAQDFADLWWKPVIKALRDEEASGLYLYSDENQRLFARFGRPPVELVPLVLDHNLRNTRQIHEAFGPLAPSRMYSRGGTGVDVRFVAASSPDEVLEIADEQVDVLLDAGWKPQHVSLITTGSRHPVQVEQTDLWGQEGYWDGFWDENNVFYAHVLGCKGLERPAVVLAVNEGRVHDRARERLYVGMSRATDQLVVVGEAHRVREIGGDAVARKLGI